MDRGKSSSSKAPRRPKWQRAFGGFVRGAASFTGASTVTVLLFLVLPVINRIAEGQTLYTVIEAPDEFFEDEPDEVLEEPEEQEEQEEEEEEPPPPEFEEDIEPLTLEQLEQALAISGTGAGPGEFSLDSIAGVAADSIQSLANLDEFGGAPRRTNDPALNLTAREKRETPGHATVKFAVDVRGRVQTPILVRASHPLLGRAALNHVKKWRFNPAMRDGKPVRAPVIQTIDFPKQ